MIASEASHLGGGGGLNERDILSYIRSSVSILCDKVMSTTKASFTTTMLCISLVGYFGTFERERSSLILLYTYAHTHTDGAIDCRIGEGHRAETEGTERTGRNQGQVLTHLTAEAIPDEDHRGV